MPLAWPIGWSGPIGGNGSLPLILSCRQALQVLAITHGASTQQVLGVSPGERATTTLRNLLALAGYRLEAKRNGRKGTASGFIEWWPNHSAGRGRPVQ